LNISTVGNLLWYERFLDDHILLIIGVQYNAPTAHSRILAMVKAHVNSFANNFSMFVNLFATNAVKITQTHSSWYEEIAWINSCQRNSDQLHAYISVVTESSEQLFSVLTLRIKLSLKLLPPMQ
jgi:hypothetical protein